MAPATIKYLAKKQRRLERQREKTHTKKSNRHKLTSTTVGGEPQSANTKAHNLDSDDSCRASCATSNSAPDSATEIDRKLEGNDISKKFVGDLNNTNTNLAKNAASNEEKYVVKFVQNVDNEQLINDTPDFGDQETICLISNQQLKHLSKHPEKTPRSKKKKKKFKDRIKGEKRNSSFILQDQEGILSKKSSKKTKSKKKKKETLEMLPVKPLDLEEEVCDDKVSDDRFRLEPSTQGTQTRNGSIENKTEMNSDKVSERLQGNDKENTKFTGSVNRVESSISKNMRKETGTKSGYKNTTDNVATNDGRDSDFENRSDDDSHSKLRIVRHDFFESNDNTGTLFDDEHIKEGDSFDNCKFSDDDSSQPLVDTPGSAISAKKKQRQCRKNIRIKPSIRTAKYSIYDDDDDDDDDEDDNSDEECDDAYSNEVSLGKLKESIMGRKLEGRYSSPDLLRSRDSQLPLSQKVMTSEGLKMELSCPICHDVLYRPVSILCGHSFCCQCLQWWIAHSALVPHEGYGRAMTNPKCPTCRRVLDLSQYDTTVGVTCPEESMFDMMPLLCVNMSLNAAIHAIFPDEMQARDKLEAAIKARSVSGENAGEYNLNRGYEVLNRIEDDIWQQVLYTDSNSFRCNDITNNRTFSVTSINARRSLVLDAYDQRMQLCLAFYGRPKIHEGTSNGNDDSSNEGSVHCMELDICLLHFEEDEAVDGLPMFVSDDGNDDDSNLISKGDPNYYSSLEVTILASQQTKVPKKRKTNTSKDSGTIPLTTPSLIQTQSLPFVRKSLGDTGIVSFSIDLSKVAEQVAIYESSSPVVLRFCHTESQAQIEIQLNRKSRYESTYNATFNQIKVKSLKRSKRKGSDYDYSQYDESSDDEEFSGEDLDKFEDDGFLVNDIDCNEVDSEECDISKKEDEDDEDHCCVCNDVGELIVCDGGDNQTRSKGCSRGYHIGCIGLLVVPPGDWICEKCAKQDLGIETGPQGYEFSNIDVDTKDTVSTENENHEPDSLPSKLKRVRQFNSDDDSENHMEDGSNSNSSIHAETSVGTNCWRKSIDDDSRCSSDDKNATLYKTKTSRKGIFDSDEDE